MENYGLDHVFCVKFRRDMQMNGLRRTVYEVLTSTSPKVALKRQYLARECRKKPVFRAKIARVLDSLYDDCTLRIAIIELRRELLQQK